MFDRDGIHEVGEDDAMALWELGEEENARVEALTRLDEIDRDGEAYEGEYEEVSQRLSDMASRAHQTRWADRDGFLVDDPIEEMERQERQEEWEQGWDAFEITIFRERYGLPDSVSREMIEAALPLEKECEYNKPYTDEFRAALCAMEAAVGVPQYYAHRWAWPEGAIETSERVVDDEHGMEWNQLGPSPAVKFAQEYGIRASDYTPELGRMDPKSDEFKTAVESLGGTVPVYNNEGCWDYDNMEPEF